MEMGRRRSAHHDLPPRMSRKGGRYYHVTSAEPRKWTPLGSDLNAARLAWARIEGEFDPALFGSAIDKFLSERLPELAPNTRKSYAYNAETLRRVFGHMPHAAIQPSHIATFLDTHERPATANIQVGLMATIFERMMRWGWTSNNPCRGIRRNPMRARERYLEDAEFLAIRAHAPDYLCAAMDVCYLTGLRVSDVVKIRLADIRPDGLYVTQKKTGKRQVYQPTEMLMVAVDRAKALRRPIRGLWLLCRRNGQPYRESTLSGAFRESAQRAGVLNARFHDIRAKAATDAKRSGQDYQALLGHAAQATSDRYVRVRNADVVAPLARKL
jgi:integrase